MRPLLASAFLLFSSSAFATVGGPQSIQLLGWDPTTESVWYLEHHHDESLDVPTLFRLPMSSRRALRVPWQGTYSDSGDWNEGIAEIRYQRVLARLRPLVELAPPQVSVSGRECSGCSIRVRIEAPGIRPAVARVRDVRGDHGAVRARRLVGVPGRSDVLAVISWFGVAVEGGYEKQTIVTTQARPFVSAPRDVQVRFEASERHMELSWLAGRDGATIRIPERDPNACRPLNTEAEIVLDAMPYVLDCGTHELRVFRERNALRVNRDADVVGRLDLPSVWRVEMLPVDVVSVGQWDDDRVTRCSRDRDCRILFRNRTLVHVAERGAIRCLPNRGRAVCLFQHATALHLHRLWLIEDGAARELAQPLEPMEIIESWGWAAAGRLRFRSDSGREVLVDVP